tara:strand:- start:15 stop:1133 length:1119 start_codon:yes stop_codon:yes gene_type:complete
MEIILNNQYNVWNKWDKLKTVLLGDTYRPEFYKDIKNIKIRDALIKISEESLKDLENYEKVLKEFGCEILRPYIDPNDNIMNYVNDGKLNHVPRAPLQPRDAQMVLGNNIYYTTSEKPFEDVLDQYNNVNKIDLRFDDERQMHRHSPSSDNVIHAPSYTLVGKDLYIDLKDRPIEDWQLDLLEKNIPNVRINYLHHGGHSDGAFHTIKNGALLTIAEIQKYPKTFPEWDIHFLGRENLKIEKFINFKERVKGKWWVPGEENNKEFTDFVETWLKDWVGYIEESVFDVNVLVLDEHNVCVSSITPAVVEFLKKHKMEPILIPWKHRYFWDGGLHCLTLDLYRESKQQDYFPNRKGSIIDYGYDQYGRPYEMGV